MPESAKDKDQEKGDEIAPPSKPPRRMTAKRENRKATAEAAAPCFR